MKYSHLNALHEARRAYIQTEANERIRIALRTKVRAAELQSKFIKMGTQYFTNEKAKNDGWDLLV